MTIRLLIKRPQPVHAEEFDRPYCKVTSPCVAPVLYPLVDKPAGTFKNALAHAAWISSAGALTIMAVNDNA